MSQCLLFKHFRGRRLARSDPNSAKTIEWKLFLLHQQAAAGATDVARSSVVPNSVSRQTHDFVYIVFTHNVRRRRKGSEKVARRWREGGEKVARSRREGGEKVARRWREGGEKVVRSGELQALLKVGSFEH
jgi:hypothetical protein